MFTFILKSVAIIGASVVAYSLATTKIGEGPIEKTHPILAIILELGTIFIIFS